MKRLIERINKMADELGQTTQAQLDRVQREGEDRRRTDRRRQDIDALRRELDAINERVHQNTRNLEIQFARMAQIQADLDRLAGQKPPRFKG